MNSALDSQIKTAFETQGMTPEEIAEEFGFPVASIKAKLMQCSSQYRKACGLEGPDEDELNFTREEQLNIKRELYNLAMGCEDEHLKGKLLLNLRDDGKGRKDAIKQIQNSPFNLLQINQVLQLGKQGAEKIKQLVQSNPIEA